MNGSDQGLTLIEVMIALFVFSVGILAVAQMQVCSLNSTAKATQGMYDSVAAGGRLEDLLLCPYEDSRLQDVDDGYHPDQPDHGPYPIGRTNSTIEWEVDDDFSTKGIKRISVTVRWRSGSAGPRSFTYEYLKSDQLI